MALGKTISEQQNLAAVSEKLAQESYFAPSSSVDITRGPSGDTSDDAIKNWDSIIEAISSGSGIVAHVTRKWQDARTYRMTNNIDSELLQAIQARRGIYDADKLALIQQFGGSTIYYRLISKLCRTAMASITDAVTSDTTPWKMIPVRLTSIPKAQQAIVYNKIMSRFREVGMVAGQVPEPEALVEMAKEEMEKELESIHAANQRAARRMEEKIYGQLSDGGFHKAFKDAIDDLCNFKVGCIKGPIPALGKKIVFRSNTAGKLMPKAKTVNMYKFNRVSPFDLFPSAGSSSVNDGDMMERSRYSTINLLEMLGQAGWQDDAIKEVVNRYGESGYQYWTSFDLQRSWLEFKGTQQMRMRGFIECIEFYGWIRGKRLKEGEISIENASEIDDDRWYHCNAIICSDKLLYFNVLDDQFSFRPYLIASYMTIPGSFWGEGIYDLVTDLNGLTAGAVRALNDNMAISSRPQKIVDVNQLAPGQDVETTVAGGVTQISPKQGASTRAIEFVNIDSHSTELLSVGDRMEKKAYEVVGLPPPDLGNAPVGQAGRTGMGMEMILGNQSRGLRFAIHQIDTQIGRPIFMQLYLNNMMYDADETIKAECDVEPQGILAAIAAAQNDSKQQEFMRDAIAPTNADVITTRGKATMFRQRARYCYFPESVVIDDHLAAKIDEKKQAAMEAQENQAATAKAGAMQQQQAGTSPIPPESGSSGEAPGEMNAPA